jgi:hypothetical protein
MKFSDRELNSLRRAYDKLPVLNTSKLEFKTIKDILSRLDKEALIQLKNSNIKWVSHLADMKLNGGLGESINESNSKINAQQKWTLTVDGKVVKTFDSKRAAVIAQNKITQTSDNWKSVSIELKESINEASTEQINTKLNLKVKQHLDVYLKGKTPSSAEFHHTIALILSEALTDSNFHSESKKVLSMFPKANSSRYKGTEMEGVIRKEGRVISKWAEWDGYDIINAFVYYVSMTIGRPVGEKIAKLKESKESVNEANPKFKITRTITKAEWDKIHKDYKSVINGVHYIMVYDNGTALVPVKIVNESVNEIASRTAVEIGALTGANREFIQNFMDKHNLDPEKVYNFVKKGKYAERADFITAVAGRDGNPIQKKLIQQLKLKESHTASHPYAALLDRIGDKLAKMEERGKEDTAEYKALDKKYKELEKKTNESKSVNEAKSTKKGDTYYVDTDFVNLSKKGGNLKHLGMGDFAVDVYGGKTISFHRVSEKIPGFSGRTHRVVGNGDDFKKLTKLMGIKSESVVKESEPCWDDYKQIGMKEKDGKKVPNCVPESKQPIKETITKEQKFKIYHKLKKGNVINIKYRSMAGTTEVELTVVKDKTLVGKSRSERITLSSKKGYKYYLYNRYGDISLAVGESAAQILDITESTKSKLNSIIIEEVKRLKESKYPLYHTSFTSAADAARNLAMSKGYKVNEDDWQTQVALGGRNLRSRPSTGKTTKFSVGLSRNGKPEKNKQLHFQVYGLESGNYELNAYVS